MTIDDLRTTLRDHAAEPGRTAAVERMDGVRDRITARRRVKTAAVTGGVALAVIAVVAVIPAFSSEAPNGRATAGRHIDVELDNPHGPFAGSVDGATAIAQKMGTPEGTMSWLFSLPTLPETAGAFCHFAAGSEGEPVVLRVHIADLLVHETPCTTEAAEVDYFPAPEIVPDEPVEVTLGLWQSGAPVESSAGPVARVGLTFYGQPDGPAPLCFRIQQDSDGTSYQLESCVS